jgi:uncharacterized protein
LPAILDTGFVVALTNSRDPLHRHCRDALGHERESLVAPQAILPEIGWLLASRLGSHAEAAFFESLVKTGWTLEPLVATDFARVTELLKTYVDVRLGFVDAAVVAVAERLGARTIYTLDRRHFAIVRPRHVDALTLRPD